MPPTDEKTDKVIPVYFAGRGIIKFYVKPWKDIYKLYNWYGSLKVD